MEDVFEVARSLVKFFDVNFSGVNSLKSTVMPAEKYHSRRSCVPIIAVHSRAKKVSSENENYNKKN